MADLDAPTPPGGPQRGDAPDGDRTPGTPATDPGPQTQRVTRDEGGHAEEPATGDGGQEDQQAEAARAVQEENAASSSDQPSQ